MAKNWLRRFISTSTLCANPGGFLIFGAKTASTVDGGEGEAAVTVSVSVEDATVDAGMIGKSTYLVDNARGSLRIGFKSPL